MAKLKCPACKHLFQQDETLGKVITCPKCAKPLKLPDQQSPEPQATESQQEERLWEVRSVSSEEIYGPYSLDEMLRYVASERISRGSPVRHPVHTLGAWIPASQINDLSGAFPPTEDFSINGFESYSTVRDRVPRLQSRAQRSSASFLMDFLDPTFKYYVTPGIIAITWILCLTVSFIGFSIFAFYAASQAVEWPEQTEVARRPQNAAERAEEMFGQMFEQPQAKADQNAQQPIREAAPEVRRRQNQEAMPQKPLPNLPWLSKKAAYSLAMTVIQLIATLISILWVRVILECIIVLFHISTAVRGLHSIEMRKAK